MKLYLIDANVLISAETQYYPRDRIPQYWDWIKSKANDGLIKMPWMVVQELLVHPGPIRNWLNSMGGIVSLLSQNVVVPSNVSYIINNGYAPNLSPANLQVMGADPYLIAEAYQINNTNNQFYKECVIVTKETPRPKAQKQNKKIPDVCKKFNIPCINDFLMYNELDFRII